ncbi:MAG TPA: type IV pilus secretin PilQ, partial [Polyangia bacterium]
MRRVSLFALATMLVLAGVASAAENVVTKVTARADGGKTVIVVHGSATPSFTAYRLEKPARVVVDVADGKIGADDLRAGPIDVDTWAVGQIAMAQYQSDVSKTARVMIGFKRQASYDVKTVGHDLVITVTPEEPMPAGADQAKLDETHKRRVEAEAQTQATEQRRLVAENAERSAVARANDAMREAEAARARAQAAKDELERVTAARKAEEARLKDVQSRASTATAQSAQSAAQLQSQRDQQRAEVAAEEERLGKLRVEAQALAAQRDAEAKKLAETQAAVRKAAEGRQLKLVEAADAARTRQAAADAARMAEERRAAARVDEATKLAQAAAAAERARATDERARASESASREADNRAAQAAARAQAAEAAARVEQEKLTALRAAADKQTAAQAAAQADLDKARAELAKLAAAQESERARVEAARRDAEAMAAERAQAVERAEHAAALASGSLEKMQAAEREARKAAEARAQESARLDGVRKEMQGAADARQKELAKLETARAESKKLEAELAAKSNELAARNDQLAKTSGELAVKSNALAAASSELDRKSTELDRKSSELQARNDELQRKTDAARATGAEAARARADLAKAQADLKKLDADRKAAEKAARVEESQAAQQSAEERARIERERGELQAQLAGERAALQKKLVAAQAEMTRVAGEQQKKQAALATARSELQSAQAEMARLVAEGDKKRAEGAALDSRLVAARAELARIEAETRRRLAMVPTPAKMAAPAPAAVVKVAAKDALPTEKLAPNASNKVRDVRFADDGDAERVIVDVGDKGAEATVLRADDNKAVLKIAGASLPKKLERTLDASAFAGPIRSVSAYADPDDAGAVRVEVALADGGGHAQPKLTRDAGTLTWEFPRAATRNVAPTRVAGYAAPVPMQLASALGGGATMARPRHVYTGRRIELDFVNADIHNIMKFIAEVGQVNIILSDDVKGTVTMHLRDVPWDQALDVIAKAKGLGVQREGNLIRVAPQSVLEKELEAEVARRKAAVELERPQTKLIPLSYADGTLLLPRIREVLSPRGTVSVDARTNQLIVTDVAANIGLAEDLVNHLDTQTPQVLIEARIVEATTNFTREIGIQWGGNTLNSAATGNATGAAFPSTVGVAGGATDATSNNNGLQLGGALSPNYVVNMPAAVGTGSGGALGLTLGSLNGAININLRLSSLENTGNVRIVSAPKIMTLDNIEASIEQGTSIPISVVSAAGANTVFVDAKLNLTVKPHVTNEGS